jgi:hypothetical protein
MKSTMPNMATHTCAKPGKPCIAFAPFDVDVMKALIERDASSEDFNAQLKAWIAADAAKNPNQPTETTDKRFRAALLSDIPFAMYCGRCLEPICFIQPLQVKEEEQPRLSNESEDGTRHERG